MRLKTAILIALVFLLALVAAFPYETLLRYKLSHAFPNLRYESLSAAPWGVRLTGVHAQVTLDQAVVFDRVRIWPSGIFPPAFKMELIRGAGRISAECSFRKKQMTVDVAVADAELHHIVPALSAGLHLTVNVRAAGRVDLQTKEGSIVLTEIRVTSGNGGFEGTGEIRPVFPLPSVTLYLKGNAIVGSQTIPVDKAVPLADFLSAG